MENGLAWFLALAVISLTQAMVLVLKISQKRAEKKNGNPGKYGERIKGNETEIKNIKEDIIEIKRDIRDIKKAQNK